MNVHTAAETTLFIGYTSARRVEHSVSCVWKLEHAMRYSFKFLKINIERPALSNKWTRKKKLWIESAIVKIRWLHFRPPWLCTLPASKFSALNGTDCPISWAWIPYIRHCNRIANHHSTVIMATQAPLFLVEPLQIVNWLRTKPQLWSLAAAVKKHPTLIRPSLPFSMLSPKVCTRRHENWAPKRSHSSTDPRAASMKECLG